MNFGLFYDDRAETHCNVNPAIAGNQPTGQMYGGYYAGLPPRPGRQLDALLPQRRAVQRPADLRLHRHGPAPDAGQRVVAQLAGTAAAGAVPDCQATDPDFSWQGQWPMAGLLADLHRPAVRAAVPGVGGALHLPGFGPDFIPTYSRRDVRGADGERGRCRRRPGAGTASGWPTSAPRGCRSSTRRSSWVTRSGACRRPARPTTAAATAAYGVEGLKFPYYGAGCGREPPEPGAVAVPRLRDRGRGDAARVVPGAGRGAAAGVRQHRRAALALSRACTGRAASSTRSTR